MVSENQLSRLKADCSQCAGLCCTALYFSKLDGFPKDKAAGVPCIHLSEDNRCKIHAQLAQKKMRGCIGYDCFGAGQQVTQLVYQGKTWRDLPEQRSEIFDVFGIVFQLCQIRFYLAQAHSFAVESSIKSTIEGLIEQNVRICTDAPGEILAFDVAAYREQSNVLLKQVCRSIQQSLHTESKPCPKDFLGKSYKGKDLGGLDLSTKLLIAADFSDCSFYGTIFLGVDTRDANFSNADLRNAVFLSQGQVNAARGSRNTKLPLHLTYPVTWK